MTSEDRIAEILWGFCEQRDAGDSVDPEQLLRDHPDLAPELRIRLLALDVVDRAAAEPWSPDIPASIGEYRVRREIGRGGMGVVYEAEQESLKRRVALKVLSLGMTGTPHAIKRFQREAQAAARLHHTNIVPVYGLDQHAGQWYYSMELVDGPPLGRVVDDLRDASGAPTEEGLARVAEGLSEESARLIGSGTGERAYFVRVAEMFAGVADALELAHQENIVHRDIKPSNLLLDADGVLKIVDFGLAQILSDGPSMTVTGDLLGTPAYMSPEQAMAKRMEVDHRTDIYSLGATLYEVLTLQRPFDGKTLQEVCSQIMTKEPEPPRRVNARVPRDLETICLKAMEKDRDKRYQSARVFARDLRLYAEGGAIFARRIGLLGRSWRRVKRHKVRSALVAAVVVMGVTGSIFAVEAHRVEVARAAERYILLCGKGYGEVVRHGSHIRGRPLPAVGSTRAVDLFTEAIELLPDRPEAYLGRALITERDTEKRLADVEAALRRGLSRRSYHLIRADVFRAASRGDDMTLELKLAGTSAQATPLDLVVEGRISRLSGRIEDAESFLSRAIGESEEGSSIRFLAYGERRWAREALGDLDGTLADLLAVSAAGDRSAATRLHLASVWQRLGRTPKANETRADLLQNLRASEDHMEWQYAIGAALRHPQNTEWGYTTSFEAVERFPASSRLAAIHAVVLGDLGRHGDAIRESERAIRLDPDDTFARAMRADALVGAGRYTDALAAAQQVHRLDPSRCRCQLSIILAMLGRPAEALAEIEAQMQRDPTHVHGQNALGRVLKRMGRNEDAIRAFRRCLDLDPSHAEATLGLASALVNLDRDKEALAVCDAAIKQRKHGSAVGCFLNCRANALRELKRFDEALEAYNRAAKHLPESWELFCERGVLLLILNRPQDALKDQDAALRILDTPDAVFNRRSDALTALKQHEAALVDAELACNLMPEWSETQTRRGAALTNLGRFDEALKAFEKALSLTSKKQRVANIHFARSRAFRGLRRFDDAVKSADKAIELEPGNSAHHEARAIGLVSQGKLEDAAAAYSVACKLAPARAFYHSMLARVSVRLKRYPEAVKAQRRACQLAPDDPVEHNNLGAWLQWIPGQEKAALAAHQKACELDPNMSLAHFNCGLMSARLGRTADALAGFERALDLGFRRGALANDVAWCRATSPDPKLRNAGRAVALARLATKRAPRQGTFWNTLGVAHYYNGQPKEALAAFEKSGELRNGGDAFDWFFVAMAEWHVGDKEKARAWYEKAVEWMAKHKPDDKELKRFRAEAEEVLGIKPK